MSIPKDDLAILDEESAVYENYPALSEIESKKAREILALRLAGLNQKAIAKRMGCTQGAISQAIKRHDPDGIYCPDMNIRKEVIKTSLGSVTLEALRMLMDKTDEMKEYSPKTLISLISQLENINDSLSGKGDAPKDTQKALSQLTSAK